MTSEDCLLIMQAREIPECLKSFEKLPIDKAYFIGYTENGLEDAIPKFIEGSDYENYLIISDDVIATESALDNVRRFLELLSASPTQRVFTGYCNVSPKLERLVNLAKSPLELPCPSTLDDYHFFTQLEIDQWPAVLIRSFTVGFVFTAMSRKLWKKYPFRSFHNGEVRGWGSDYNLSWRLQEDGVPIYGVKNAYCEHLGGNLSLPATLVGRVAAHVKLVKAVCIPSQ